MLVVTALFVSAASAQSIQVGGACPGPMTGSVTGITANGDYAVVTGTPGGQTIVPQNMQCAGAVVPLANPVVRSIQTADARGADQLQANVPQNLCGQQVLLVDLRTCSVGRPARI